VHAGATRLAGDTWKITLVVQNEGYLPTYVSKRALKRKTARGVVAELDLPPGLALEAGKLLDEHGQLEGRAYKHTGVSFWPDYNVTDDRMKLEWVVRGPAAQSVAITARHERAGTVRTTVELT